MFSPIKQFLFPVGGGLQQKWPMILNAIIFKMFALWVGAWFPKNAKYSLFKPSVSWQISSWSAKMISQKGVKRRVWERQRDNGCWYCITGPEQDAREDDTDYSERGKEPLYPLIKRWQRSRVCHHWEWMEVRNDVESSEMGVETVYEEKGPRTSPRWLGAFFVHGGRAFIRVVNLLT